MSRSIALGGTANFGLADNFGGFVVAMTGEFRGGAFARVVGEPIRTGNTTTADLEHVFIREDGSMLFTRDKSVWTHADGTPSVAVDNVYNVVRATGAFAGLTGSFKSWGSLNPQTGEGVLRFGGTLTEA